MIYISDQKRDQEISENDFIDIESQLEEYTGDYRRKNKVRLRLIGLIVLIAFLLLSFPYWLFDDKLDFLQYAQNPTENQLIQEVGEAVVSIRVSSVKNTGFENKIATGFNINNTGIIVTNRHVLEQADSARIEFQGEKVYYSDDFYVFDNTDLAYIFINCSDLPKVDFADTGIIPQGSKVTVIGNPIGMERVIFTGSILGYSSADNGEIPLMCIDTACQKGNSGSPVFDEEGKVVGVVFAVAYPYDSETKYITLAIPVDVILNNPPEGI